MFIFHCYTSDPVENSGVFFAFMEANFTDVLFPGTVSTVASPVPTWAFFKAPRPGCVILTAYP